MAKILIIDDEKSIRFTLGKYWNMKNMKWMRLLTVRMELIKLPNEI
jgi:hypothetical protein